MPYPQSRSRRLRRTETIRRMARETIVSPNDLVLPLFVVPGLDVKLEIDSMPGCGHLSQDLLVGEAASAYDLGIRPFCFGLPANKDETGSEAWADDGVVQRAVRLLKRENPDLVVITDVCLCAYTSHGHCGVLERGDVLNDETLPPLCQGRRIPRQSRCGHRRAVGYDGWTHPGNP